MNCTNFQSRLTEYIDDELSADDRRQMSGHAEACPACRRTLEQTTQLHDCLLQDGATVAPALGNRVMHTIHQRSSCPKENPVWRMIMAHRITALSIGLAACLVVAATIVMVFALPNESTIGQLQPPTTLPGKTLPPAPTVRGSAGARPLEQRLERASLVVRAAVEHVGEPDSEDVAADAPVRYRIIRVLKGTLPDQSPTLTVPTTASMVVRSGGAYAIGKEQILFLEQSRDRTGRLVTRPLSANYDSGAGRLDEVEEQILDLVGNAEQPLIPEGPRRVR